VIAAERFDRFRQPPGRRARASKDSETNGMIAGINEPLA